MGRKYPKWGYDKKLDIGYLDLLAGEARDDSTFIEAPNVTLVVDFDDAGNVLGVEVIGR